MQRDKTHDISSREPRRLLAPPTNEASCSTRRSIVSHPSKPPPTRWRRIDTDGEERRKEKDEDEDEVCLKERIR